MNNRSPLSCVMLSLLCCACSKQDENIRQQQQQTNHVFSVYEYKTNIPIEGATVALYTCTRYDAVFGCRNTGVSTYKLTDSRGQCSFSDAEYRADEGIKITKAGYWTQGGSTQNFLQPEALLNLRLIRQNNFPDSSYISIQVAGEFGKVSSLTFKAPSDSVVTLKVFGNQNNNSSWTLFTKSPTCLAYCITDTLTKGNFSKPLAKSETGSHTLNY